MRCGRKTRRPSRSEGWSDGSRFPFRARDFLFYLPFMVAACPLRARSGGKAGVPAVNDGQRQRSATRRNSSYATRNQGAFHSS